MIKTIVFDFLSVSVVSDDQDWYAREFEENAMYGGIDPPADRVDLSGWRRTEGEGLMSYLARTRPEKDQRGATQWLSAFMDMLLEDRRGYMLLTQSQHYVRPLSIAETWLAAVKVPR